MALLLCVVILNSISMSGRVTGTNTDSLPQKDKEEIISVIERSYVAGMLNAPDVELIRSGWYHSADIHVFLAARDTCVTGKIEGFIRMAASGADRPAMPEAKALYKHIAVTGTAAVAIVEIFAGENQLYTDFLNLYRFKNGWRIVTKTFYDHQTTVEE
ncbi:MAG: nuclear transport factor 2 family protein [Bacteroidales bacterium]|jgi:hypothetical protein|nr:nuclear transport factor 2 family protein [Bacteroidales bacterium]